MQFQPKGVVVLECVHCGFEFLVMGEAAFASNSECFDSNSKCFDIIALRKRVKDFNLK